MTSTGTMSQTMRSPHAESCVTSSLRERGVSSKEASPNDRTDFKGQDLIDYFPHLPGYKHPQTGFVSRLPPTWIPYAQLLRLDRPAGFKAFYIPYLIGLVYAACLQNHPDWNGILRLGMFFVPFNVVLRGVTCAWNDNVDQEFDRQVERCRHRPIARGAISTSQANIFIAALTAMLYPFLGVLPQRCTSYTALTVVLFFIYALLKRVTYYPPVFLGFPFACGLLTSLTACDIDPWNAEVLPSFVTLFLSLVLWTISYETIYAHQDIVDDEKAGVKGMAIRFRNSTKLLATFLTAVQVILLAASGYWAHFGFVYFVGTLGGVTVSMGYFIYSVDLRKPKSCGAWFGTQFWTVGAAYVAGLAGEYISQGGDFWP